MAGTSELYFARGAGDSMYPTIGNGDVLLIDRRQNALTMGVSVYRDKGLRGVERAGAQVVDIVNQPL
ncbi:S24 family peptidase [Asticcacaulis excentricus]|uniref:S24 family peptidase n=1 Tax=Asticcacaulis excentricus TaxID=78587 RepID=UPI000F816F41|nr:S24 family peptidase [Asticcacaulis excentricus]